MSLDCEGDGVPCVECGELDFLPYTCPWCRGTFCAAHVTCHHIPLHGVPTAAGAASVLLLNDAARDAEASSSARLCTPPQVTTSTLTAGEATTASSTSPGRPQHRCVVCQSALCALAPCPECGDSYCAAHRFHGHRDVRPKEWSQGRANQRAVSFERQQSSSSARTVDPAAALCAPFTSAHPLVLAPVGYRSRRMGVLAFIVAPATAPARTFMGTLADRREATTYSIGVCSLIVATEMSVGQLRDRLVGFLRDVSVSLMEQEGEATGLMVSPGWSEWVSSAHTSLLTVAAAASDTDSVAVVGSTSARVPALSLVELPVDVILRKAPMANATVLLSLSNATEERTVSKENVALRRLLTTVLYGNVASPRAPSSSFTAAPSASAIASDHPDDRVKALATRLYLQYQQLLRRAAADTLENSACTAGKALGKAERSSTESLEDGAGASAQAIKALVVPAPDTEGEVTLSPPTVVDAARSVTPSPVAAVWPFRHSPPLSSFDFFNGKLSPCGAAAIRPASAPRVVVAVFVADATLPVAVMPMCIAIGHDWPLARVVHRLREEVGEQQLAQHRDARAALSAFSLYRLGNGISSATGTAWGGGLSCLWSDQTQPPTSSAPVPLQNADVLLLCPADSPAAEGALLGELRRLQGLTGKAKAALEADQLKKANGLRWRAFREQADMAIATGITDQRQGLASSFVGISVLAMSESVVRAERELYGYVVALQSALQAATEDAMAQSVWDGAREEDGVLTDSAADESHHNGVPDTLIQQVEGETAFERRRIHELVRRQLTPQRTALRAAIIQLGGGQDASGNVIDVPVAVLDQEIAAAATESAELGRRMVELYDEAALLATRIEAEVMSKSVPSL